MLTLVIRSGSSYRQAGHTVPPHCAAHLSIGIELTQGHHMQDKPDRELTKYAGLNRPPLGFPTAMKFCPTCQMETPHQFRGFGGGGSVRVCVRCLERALDALAHKAR